MKNSIMKKTWGILLGFGLSLATAAFVLTGCDLDVVEEDDITVTLSDGTPGDNKVLLTLTGATWNAVNTWADIGALWLFDPDEAGVADTPTTVTGTRTSSTVAEFAFTGRAYDGKVQIDTNPTYFAKLKALTNIGIGSMAAVSDWVNIVVTTASQEEPGDDDDDDDTTGGTAQGLADALNAISSGTATVSGTTVTLAKSVSLTEAYHITVPEEVIFVSPGGSVKLTMNGGTLTVDGTFQVRGSDIEFGSTKSTIDGKGTIEKVAANTSAAIGLSTGSKLDIKGVTLKGITTGTQSAAVISVPASDTVVLNLDGVTVTGNKSTSTTGGGGLAIAGGTVTLTNSIVSHNEVSTSGATGAGIRIAGGTVTLNGGTSVEANNASSATGYGGGVWVVGSSAKLYLDNATIYGSADNSSAATKPDPATSATNKNYSAGGDAIGFASGGKVYAGSGASAFDLTTSGVFEASVGGDTNNATEYTLFVDASGSYSKAAR